MFCFINHKSGSFHISSFHILFLRGRWICFCFPLYHVSLRSLAHQLSLLYSVLPGFPSPKTPYPQRINMLRLPTPQKQKENLSSPSTSLTQTPSKHCLHLPSLLLHLPLAVQSSSLWDYSKKVNNKHGAELGSSSSLLPSKNLKFHQLWCSLHNSFYLCPICPFNSHWCVLAFQTHPRHLNHTPPWSGLYPMPKRENRNVSLLSQHSKVAGKICSPLHDVWGRFLKIWWSSWPPWRLTEVWWLRIQVFVNSRVRVHIHFPLL